MAKQRKRSKTKRIYTVLMMLFIVAAGIWELWQNPGIFETITDRAPTIESDGSMAVHYIDVGQGDAQLIVAPDKTAMLIDAGPNSAADRLLAYLDAQNIKELEYAVFTHPHEDHIGGADSVLNKIKVKNVIMPDVTDTSDTFLHMLEAIDKNGSAIIIPEAGQSFMLGDSSFIILAPVTGNYTSLNDWSVVLRLDYGKTSFMFTGDAEIRSENEMMNKFDASEFKCDVYKAGHHGSTTSNSKAFLAVCGPSAAVISCGKDNDYGHPHYEIIKLFSDMGLEICRTDTDGTVVFKSDGSTVTRIK
jgi:competence protein ComEC